MLKSLRDYSTILFHVAESGPTERCGTGSLEIPLDDSVMKIEKHFSVEWTCVLE
jgi:hypothetical protein